MSQKEYLLHPFICPICGNIIPFEKKNNKTCSRSCAVKLGNIYHSKESRINQKSKLKETLSIKFPKKEKIKKEKIKKIQYCKICGCEKGKCKDKFVCSKYRLFNTLKLFGLNLNLLGTEEFINDFYRIKDLISLEYNINRITEKELKEKYNYNSGLSNFHKILKSLNINSLPLSESIKLAYKLGRIENPGYLYFKDSLHKSWQGKEYHLRSSYELDYAKELDENHIKYDYENLRIQYKDYLGEFHTYIPDFYLIDTNTIVEIKSSFTLDIQNIKDKMKACLDLGYNFKLICDHKEMSV